MFEWSSRQNLEIELSDQAKQQPAASYQMTGSIEAAVISDPEEMELLCEASSKTDRPHDSEYHPRVLLSSHLKVQHGGRSSRHRIYTLRAGSGASSIVKNVESQDIYIITKLLKFEQDYYAVCELLQSVRCEHEPIFPLLVRSGTITLVHVSKLSKPAIYYYHSPPSSSSDDTYTVLNDHTI